MSINIPNKEQWAKLNEHLNNIAGVLGTQVDVSTWEGVQKAVRAGLAPELFPIGTQLVVNHSVYGEMLFDVVAHDYLKPHHNSNAHTMTLLSHNLLPAIQYDAEEAVYYAESELPAGTYNFVITRSEYPNWSVGTYYFTLTQVVPKGGQLVISNVGKGAVESKMVSYANAYSTTPIESVLIRSGSNGTCLGTITSDLNTMRRMRYGSSNYKESAIRQFLNSKAEAGSVWTPQTKFDRPPDWVATRAGFMNGLDSDFLAVVGEVNLPCYADEYYQAPDSTTLTGEKYTVKDKFYLPSLKEITGKENNPTTPLDDSILFPYYENAGDIDRIKYENGVARRWITRNEINCEAVKCINTSGETSLCYVNDSDSDGMALACTIV